MTPSPANPPPRLCPICAAPDPACAPVFIKHGHRIYRCPGCGVLHVHPQPTLDELKKIYTAAYFQRGNKYRPRPGGIDPNRLNDLKKLDLLRRHGADASRLLDVGCAMGGFLAAARERGFAVSGVEISPAAAAHARDALGLDVFTGVLADAPLAAASFDAVTMWDVLEHLTDPLTAVRQAARLLRPGGLLALTTGDAGSAWARLTGRRWPLLTPPQHLFYFNRASLRRLLELADLDLREFSYSGKIVNLEFAGFKLREAFGPALAPAARLARLPGLRRLCLPVNLRDIVTGVAIKQRT